MSILPHIQRYRELLHVCETGNSMGIADVLSLEQLGSLLNNQAQASASPTITAILGSGNSEQHVELQELGPDHVVCGDCPRVLPGTSVSLRLDDTTEDVSYLFRALVTFSCYSPADLSGIATQSQSWSLRLSFVGQPVVLSWGRGRAPSSDAVLKLESNLKLSA